MVTGFDVIYLILELLVTMVLSSDDDMNKDDTLLDVTIDDIAEGVKLISLLVGEANTKIEDKVSMSLHPSVTVRPINIV